jgi:hypothetical protein
MGIYQELLGDDDEMRKAQALFILAEGALNMAAARGGNTADKIARGLKGVPSAFGALGAEKAKQDMAIKTAAISSVEQEMRDEAKYTSALINQLARFNAKNAGLEVSAKLIRAKFGISPRAAMDIAILTKNGDIAPDDKTGEVYHKSGFLLHSPLKPLQDGDVGYLPRSGPKATFVIESGERLTPAIRGERADLIAKKRANQELVLGIERLKRSRAFETAFGPLARFQSGLTTITVPIFGEQFFTDVQKQQFSNEGKILNREIMRLGVLNQGRPSVWDQQQVKETIPDPDKIFESPDQVFAMLNNFRVNAINEINRIDHQLNPDEVPLKQLDPIPIGTSQDPLRAKDANYMAEFFRLRPGGSLYIQRPDVQNPNKTVTEKVTGDQFFAQFPDLRPR